MISSIKLLEKLKFEIGGFSQGYESILLKDNEIFYKEHQFIDLLEPTKTVTDTQIIRTTTTRHVLKYVYVLILLLLHENFIVVLHMS